MKSYNYYVEPLDQMCVAWIDIAKNSENAE